MALSERLAYILDFNVASGIRSLEQVGRTAERELGKAEQKLDKISSNLTKFGTGAVAVAGVAGAALFRMGQGAAEAEANFAGLEQIVGSTIARSIGDWAKDGAENLGLSERAIYKASTAFGSLGIVAGKTDAELEKFIKTNQTMAADFAAVADVAPTQVIDDLRAAYAGSGEVLQKYNIFVNDTNIKQAILAETGEKITGTLTSQQRVLGVNLLLQQEHAKVAGQWSRESGELAGQQAQLSANLQNLSDNIGRGVLPMITKITASAASAAGALASMDEATGGTIGKFAALGTVGVGLVGTLSLVAGQAIKMRDRFTTLGADGERSLNRLGLAARGVGVAIGIASVALAAYSAYQAKAEGDVRDLADAFASTARESDEALGKMVTQMVTLGKVTGDLEPAVKLFVQGNIEAARRLVETGAAAEAGSEFLDMLTEAIKAEEAARANAVRTAEEYADAEDTATEATTRSTDAIRAQDEMIAQVNQTHKQQQAELERSAEKQEQAEEAARAYQDALDAQRRAIDNLNNANLAMLGSDIAVREAKRQSADALAEFTEVTKNAEQGTREYEEAADNATLALLGQASAAAEYRAKQAEANGETVTAADKADLMRQELENIATMLGPGNPLFAGLQAYIDQLNNIPRNVSTTLTLRGGGSISVGGAGGNINTTGRSGTRHSGGRTDVGTAYHVLPGEVFVPDVPGAVRSRPDAARMQDAAGGGMSFTTIIEGNVYGVDDLERRLDERDRRLAARITQGRRG